MYKLYNNIIIILTLFMHECTGMSTVSTVTLRTALVSVTCLLVLMAALIYILGFVCDRCLSQRWQESSGRNKQSESHNMVSDLELKENVAYITLHSTAQLFTTHGSQEHKDVCWLT